MSRRFCQLRNINTFISSVVSSCFRLRSSCKIFRSFVMSFDLFVRFSGLNFSNIIMPNLFLKIPVINLITSNVAPPFLSRVLPCLCDRGIGCFGCHKQVHHVILSVKFLLSTCVLTLRVVQPVSLHSV